MATQPICCLKEVNFMSCVAERPQGADAGDAATDDGYTFPVHLFCDSAVEQALSGDYTNTKVGVREDDRKQAKQEGSTLLRGMEVLMSSTRKRIWFQLVQGRIQRV